MPPRGHGRAQAYFRAHLGETGAGCLIWPYAVMSEAYPYGIVRIDGKQRYVHRLSCEHRWGPAPAPRMQAAHLPLICHNPRCWRGEHLRWATRSENEDDKYVDGTGHMMKLSRTQVSEIRDRYAIGGLTYIHLAREYGVHDDTIARIVRRETWSDR